MPTDHPQPLDYEAAGKRCPKSKLFSAMTGIGVAWATAFGVIGLFAGMMAGSGMADEPGDPATWADGAAVFCIVGAVGLPGVVLAWFFGWLNYRPHA